MGKTYADGRKRHPPRPLKWTPERVIAAIRLWVERYGRPPKTEEWHPGQPHFDRATWGTGEFPSDMAVKARFGSWPAGMRAAGFEPVGPPGRVPVPPKNCAHCGKPLVRREDERRWSYMHRRHCDTRCGGYTAAGDAARERFERIIALRREGKSNIEIAAIEGCQPANVAQWFQRARARGMDVPLPPYWLRGKSGRASRLRQPDESEAVS